MVSKMMLLTVLSGPDEGMTKSYRQSRVTMGRGEDNDFVLNDGFVSNRHAELLFDNGEIVFRDLGSRHGSTVVTADLSRKLHDAERATQLPVVDGTEVQVGSTLIRLSVADTPQTARQNAELIDGRNKPAPSSPGLTVQDQPPDGEHLITAAHQPVTTINRRLQSADERLATLFHLAGQLNGLTTLDEILDLIIETTFDSFPATNFFAVTLGSDPDELSTQEPFLTRIRGKLPGASDDETPILSSSILRRVAETQESVLFTKDSLGSEVTQSILDAQITACMCAPLVGQKSLLGLMQVDTRGKGTLFTRQDLELFNILASNAAFAIERARLTESIVEMFDGFVAASVNAIEARDPVTAGHSERVAHYTNALAETVNDIEAGRLGEIYFDADEMRELRYAALLHDFGKIAVGEDVLQKGARLAPERMRLIRQRFDTIKELAHCDWLRTHIRDIEAAGDVPTARALADIDRQYEGFCAELDEIYEWLVSISTKGYLEQDELDRIRNLGQQTFRCVDGRLHPYLLADEVENLCIQKGTLNEDEWVEMRSHAALSESYLDQIPWSDELQQIPCIAGAHHEKLDGSGYPLGLSEDEILPQVRMLTISDIFDALTASDRPYRKAATIDRALHILDLEANEDKLDADMVEVFAKMVIPKIRDDVPRPND